MAKAKRAAEVSAQFIDTAVSVTLTGAAPIMFDHFIRQDTGIPPEEKLYLDAERRVCLPAANIESMLFSTIGSLSAMCRFGPAPSKIDRAALAVTCAAMVRIAPDMIPLIADGQILTFGTFEQLTGRDESSGLWIHKTNAPAEKAGGKIGTRDVRNRPVRSLPWALSFTLHHISVEISPTLVDIEQLLRRAGYMIGLGTYRPRFGRFLVSEWVITEQRRL